MHLEGKGDMQSETNWYAHSRKSIGSAIAREFAHHQCNLALTYATNLEAATQLSKELQQIVGTTRHVSIHKADLAVPEEIEHLCLQVQQTHNRPVSILIPNAGYGKRIRDVSYVSITQAIKRNGSLIVHREIPLDEFDRMININLRAPFLLVKGVVDGMKEQNWGRIIFVSSIAAHGGGMNGCHYAASKGRPPQNNEWSMALIHLGGLMGMMKNLATTLSGNNISVNDIAPAMVGNTGMVCDMPRTSKYCHVN